MRFCDCGVGQNAVLKWRIRDELLGAKPALLEEIRKYGGQERERKETVGKMCVGGVGEVARTKM